MLEDIVYPHKYIDACTLPELTVCFNMLLGKRPWKQLAVCFYDAKMWYFFALQYKGKITDWSELSLFSLMNVIPFCIEQVEKLKMSYEKRNGDLKAFWLSLKLETSYNSLWSTFNISAYNIVNWNLCVTIAILLLFVVSFNNNSSIPLWALNFPKTFLLFSGAVV